MFTIGSAELDALLLGYFYPFVRILALATSAPVFSHQSVPRPVRIGLAALVTALVVPVLPAIAPVSPFTAPGILLLVEQILIGIAIGFSMQLAFAAVTLAGDLIGLQMGLSFAAFIDPQHSEQTPVIGSFLAVTLMLVFLSISGHLLLLETLVESFRRFPVALEAIRPLDAAALVRNGALVFSAGLQIALPVVGAMLMTNLTVGLLARTSPQLNLLSVGFPVSLIVGFLMLLLALPALGPGMGALLSHGLAPLR